MGDANMRGIFPSNVFQIGFSAFDSGPFIELDFLDLISSFRLFPSGARKINNEIIGPPF